jgi:hypothetical protein
MPEQVVSKIRAATESLPPLQKRILEDAEKEGRQWTWIEKVPAVYCVFKGKKCVYVGRTNNIAARVNNSHPAARRKDCMVYYLALFGLSVRQLREIEAELAYILQPAMGFIRGYGKPRNLAERRCAKCGHKWIPRTKRLTIKCPNHLCASPYWNGKG